MTQVKLSDAKGLRQPAWINHSHVHFALIVLFGVLIYSNSMNVPFYFDDFSCILDNPVVKDITLAFDHSRLSETGISEDIRNSITTRIVSYWTFSLNYRIHGFDLYGYHLVNLIIHLANALLVYLLVQTTLARCRSEVAASGKMGSGLALAVALLFVSHPIQTNSVTYITQRMGALATFFCFGALLAYIQAMLSVGRIRRRISYAIALLATLLGIFTKEVVFALPVVITLYDRIFFRGSQGRRWERLLPFYAAVVPLPLTVFYLASLSKVTDGKATRFFDLMNYSGLSNGDYFFNQLRVIVFYLRLLVFPDGLNLDHDFVVKTTFFDPATLCAGLLLAGLLIVGISLCLRSARPVAMVDVQKNGSLIGFGLIWFFVTLSISSSVIPLDDMVMEYRLYLPSFGVFLAIAGSFDRLRQGLMQAFPKLLFVIPIMAAIVVLGLGATTMARNRLWQDNVAFYEDSVAKSPGKARPLQNLATAYLNRDQPKESLFYAGLASEARDNSLATRSALARIFNRLGRDDLAIREVQEVIKIAPTAADSYAVLGQLYLNTGRNAEAVEAFKRAIKLGPTYPEDIQRSIEAIDSLPVHR